MSALPVIAFIGTGVMGRSMAGHLLRAGHPVHVFNRTKEKAQALLDAGARWHDSAGDAAAIADVVITMLGFPQDVEQTYLGTSGIVARAKTGALLIDMTTSSPVLARRIADAATKRGLASLDAPVSGGDVGAKNAALSIMVGGDADVVDAVRPLLECMGKTIIHQGPAGAGQHTKMVNQVLIATNMIGV